MTKQIKIHSIENYQSLTDLFFLRVGWQAGKQKKKYKLQIKTANRKI